MKPRYYPLLTFCGATLLIIVPVAFIWLIAIRSADDIVGFPDLPESSVEAVAANRDSDAVNKAVSSFPVVDPPPVPEQHHNDRTRTDVSGSRGALNDDGETRTQVAFNAAEEKVESSDTLSNAETVPSPHDAGKLPELEVQLNIASLLPETTNNAAPESERGEGKIPGSKEEEGRPTAHDPGLTYYQSTGHLALAATPTIPAQRGSGQGTTNAKRLELSGASSPEQDNSGKSTGSRAGKKTSETSMTKASRTPAAVAEPAKGQSAAGNTEDNPFLVRSAPPGTGNGNPHAPAEEVITEDVILQTPAENVPVDRVENVVAATKAKGWPIALVRSDLPDDVWWVQQVIGIQGTSFAARANFGNEYSVSGSAYRMVIVFLDSPDEVRRFRIAKQFKEIPAGVRRSREFFFIRK